jgi:hypothetical protein
MTEMATGQARGPAVLVGVFAGVIALALLGGIVWASAASDVVAGLRYLAADRWGVVTLIDVYAGAFVVAVWMWVHERRLVRWVPWVVALMCLGHLVSLVYLLVWLRRGGMRA